MSDFSHLDDKGQARMVDVGEKSLTVRKAKASARVRTRPEVIAMILAGSIKKGDVLAVARIAGIQAAKKTPGLIPLCHPLLLDQVTVEIECAKDHMDITAHVRCRGRTGVEMEALCAASVTALTLYDMCKSVDKAMAIEWLRLEEKSGGKSGSFVR
jgi:cyclic pyranopterin phosphate synthase